MLQTVMKREVALRGKHARCTQQSKRTRPESTHHCERVWRRLEERSRKENNTLVARGIRTGFACSVLHRTHGVTFAALRPPDVINQNVRGTSGQGGQGGAHSAHGDNPARDESQGAETSRLQTHWFEILFFALHPTPGESVNVLLLIALGVC